jgi:hypothetical protein
MMCSFADHVQFLDPPLHCFENSIFLTDKACRVIKRIHRQGGLGFPESLLLDWPLVLRSCQILSITAYLFSGSGLSLRTRRTLDQVLASIRTIEKITAGIATFTTTPTSRSAA